MVTNNACDEPTAASGKVLQGQGVGTANNFSTATYPSTATGTGKILRADGTNWVATTATYPDAAGSSGNVLTSDGTNWTSSAPSAGNSINGFVNTLNGNPADSTTYYFAQSVSLITNTAATAKNVQFYIPFSCTLTKVYGSFNTSTGGSSENITIFVRVNNTTNTNVTTTFKLVNSGVTVNQFSNSGLSISLNAGDYISIGMTTPAWATNPLSVVGSVGWSS